MDPDYIDREQIWTIVNKLFYILHPLTDKKKKTTDGCTCYLNQSD